MSTTTTTTPPTTPSDTLPLPTPPVRGSRVRTAVWASVAALAAAGVTAGLVVGLGGTPGPTTAPEPLPVPPVVHAPAQGGSHAVTPVVPAKPVTPVAPSAAIETLQRELGQLNYYEGPITGTMNQQTVQAITYLQRDAHLPQTGTMNAQTQAALANFLAHGNNQMGN